MTAKVALTAEEIRIIRRALDDYWALGSDSYSRIQQSVTKKLDSAERHLKLKEAQKHNDRH